MAACLKQSAVVLISFLAFTGSASDLGNLPEQPFSNRIIFSQTPEIGEKWHGGIRMNDIVVWDMYWNCGNWFTLDLLSAGVREINLQGEDNDTITLTDYFTLFSIKSRPFSHTLLNNPYLIAGGITTYTNAFQFINQFGEGMIETPSHELSFFLTQSWHAKKRHYVNLVSSVSFMKTEQMEKAVSSIYLVPGYHYFIDKKARWSFDIEYYFMNPIELPMKTLQYGFDPDQNEFYNPEQLFVSFTFWGFSYTRKHLCLELHLGHHISFAGPVIPFAGIGWDF
ncbi:MAG: hypothetical protein JW768_13335 [Chitinispirillaceae bacterium]|nr:hypothetical protein [Chitinispirillaceae bacterium]